mgnify:CR=1 FL=1
MRNNHRPAVPRGLIAAVIFGALGLYWISAAVPALAQPADSDAEDVQTSVQAADPEATTADETETRASGDGVASDRSTATSSQPPVDYRPSESISEDRSVSFPVDI